MFRFNRKHFIDFVNAKIIENCLHFNWTKDRFSKIGL